MSAIGVGVQENLASLRAMRDGIGKAENFHTAIDVPVGELRKSNADLKRMLQIDERKTISRTALLGMLAAKEAVEDARIENRTNVAFISATTVGGMDLTPMFYAEYMNDSNRGKLRYVAQHDCASSTNLIADYCHLGGYRTAISTACSSAANAIMMGARLIENGLCDVVVAGGTDALCQYTIDGFRSLMILDGDKCRPFDETRSGLNLGEGAAYLVLQQAEDATHAYCRIAGYANANDAFHQTAVSSEGLGPVMAMRGAIEKSGFRPQDISYINAHGTGTSNNDASEASAIATVWSNTTTPPFSSTKALTGHTLAAAGSIEAVYSILSIEHQQIWGNKNFSVPMTHVPIVPERETHSARVDAVLSNSFGFGGNCTSLIFAKI